MKLDHWNHHSSGGEKPTAHEYQNSSSAEEKKELIRELTSSKMRWLSSILAMLSVGSLTNMMLSSKEPDVYFPVRLRGPVVVVILMIALVAFSTLAIVNWVIWLKNRKR